jgi:hypothetical protein
VTTVKRRTPTSKTPFVLLMVLLLGGGLLGLLLLNTALNQGSFEESRLEKQNAKLSDQEQELRRELDRLSAPGELARRAAELGMIPGGAPAFLDPVTGDVYGSPKPATPKPVPTTAAPSLPPGTPLPPGTAVVPVAPVVPGQSAPPAGAPATQAPPH